jgi:hypothetical protein
MKITKTQLKQIIKEELASVTEKVVKRGDKYVYVSKKGKVLGRHKTRKAAEKQATAIRISRNVGESRDLPDTDFELYGQLLDLTKELQGFKDNLDYAMGLTASADKRSRLKDKTYEMMRKALFDLETARTEFAKEIGQDPAPELAAVREEAS